MAYIDPASPLYLGPDNALPELVRLTKAARQAGEPVFFTNISYAPGGRERGPFYRKVPALKAFHHRPPLSASPPPLLPQHRDPVAANFSHQPLYPPTLDP